MFDLIVRSGLVVDGTGGPPVPADVGVRDGRIAALGRLGGASAGTVVEAAGRYVLPGFVDAHSHTDAAVLRPDVQLALLRQGITTVVCGQDGLSYAPADAAAAAFVARYFAAIIGAHPDLAGPATVAELLDSWRGRIALNAAYLVPHGTVRFSVLGGAPRDADADELARMRRLVERALADGAVGLSTGLEYLPGRYASAAEVAELCRPVAAAGLPYVTHMRGYGPAAPAAMVEARAIAHASGAPLHVSHLHGDGPALASIVDDAHAAGLDVTFDTYPYLRSCTILAMAALPRWLGGTDLDAATAALRDGATRARVLAALDPRLWPRITFAHVPDPHWAWVEGHDLPAVAARAGLGQGEALVEILAATGLAASAVITAPATTTEESMRQLLRHDAHVGGSDGIVIGGHPHPRAWGAFARFLGRHVRELADWTWPQAAVHLAARPAWRFGLTDRGMVAEGLAADLAIVDPTTVGDTAWYDDPRRLADGVTDVVVNGVRVLRGGELTGRLAGLALRPNPGR